MLAQALLLDFYDRRRTNPANAACAALAGFFLATIVYDGFYLPLMCHFTAMRRLLNDVIYSTMGIRHSHGGNDSPDIHPALLLQCWPFTSSG